MMTKTRTCVPFLLCLTAALQIVDAETVGWRTNWTGKYPDARPPTQWSASENVVWKTPMPNWGNATPVIVGHRLFVCSEPTTLLCVDVDTGAILWQKTNTYLDALSPDEAARAQQLIQEVDLDGTTKQLRSAEGQLTRVKNKLKKTPDDAALQQEKTDTEKQIGQLNSKLEPVADFVMPRTQAVNGYSSSTPVSDGRHVYVLFGTGVAACYDMEGNRKWIKVVEKPTADYGHSASPLLAGGRLIVHVRTLIALDKNTGEVVWKSGSASAWGTSTVTKIGADEVIITPRGDFFLAADGRRIANRTGRLDFNQPIIEDGIVYFIQNGGKAFRVPASADQRPAELWTTQPHKDRYYASPVIHEGLIYAITQFSIFSAIDAETGQVVYEQKLDLGRQQAYPSVCLAGRYLFVGSSNGTTVVIEPGRSFKEVRRNRLEPFRSTPVFQGTRMYIRGLKNLYCIGS
jgi:outer membrane protein assembly factor BamB